ncbi:diguanylate cyclase/phosphodiesterase [Rhizobium sp. RU20A]|uniref:putative bifunctional diguanylate cyclase/phosphodiesterase n=1 Tax=Rhizobium sp. RU20A TaxID=1907412 RepID=UPI000957184E|nr:GGDEF and EAL domain-containing protein [Rhizobium sp. RU20A]SIR01795.1 diguanylate cyclase/phosphodiesterase [Rhizobium sp. RU20A]
MTLIKRTSLLIFPVVLVGYVVAAILVYVAESRALRALEEAKLAQQLDHLAALFDSDLNQSRTFLYGLADGSALRLFIEEQDESYRSAALGVRLQQAVKSLSADPRKFVSFTILKPDLSLSYYFENSDDPFATLSSLQRENAKKLKSGADLVAWSFLEGDGQRPLIVYSQFVDPRTFNPPIASEKSRALLLQGAVKPDRFLDMRAGLEREYGAPVIVSRDKPSANTADLAASVQLGGGMFASIVPDARILDQTLGRLRMLLGIGATVLALVTLGLLTVLIRRFVIEPITELDRNVTKVMTGSTTQIVSSNTVGEVARLTDNIQKLHEKSQQTLLLVQKASWTDPLTGLANRAHFNVIGETLVRSMIETDSACALFFIDVDNFKFVNDRYGHKIGDDLLRHLAERISATVNAIAGEYWVANAIVARLSGDEFAILIPTQTHTDMVDELAGRILNLFANGFEVHGERYPVTASIGVAFCPTDGSTLASLVANADAAMYQSKGTGKNRFAYFSRTLEEKQHRIRQIQDELRLADPDEQFHLVYMPLINRQGKVAGCEALLRWRSPVLGPVGPDEFVPIAERHGLFAKIDFWVIDRAIADCARLQDIFGPDTVVAINISSAELHSTAITDHIVDRLRHYKVDARSVEIELTETFAVSLGDQLRQNIQRLREGGLRIAIDDFGAGYTSVQQIIDYMADTIKLDRDFVGKLTADHMHPTLRAMNELCHAQKMRVVAEGVETREQLETLMSAGCDYFQGYFFSKPRQMEDLQVWALRHANQPPVMPSTPKPTRTAAARRKSA